MVGPEPFERSTNLRLNMILRQSFLVGSLARAEPDLAGQNNIIPMTLQELTNDLLRSTVGVNVRGVVEVYSKVESPFHYRLRLVNLDHPLILVSKRHCSKANAGHLHPSLAKTSILHDPKVLIVDIRKAVSNEPPSFYLMPICPGDVR